MRNEKYYICSTLVLVGCSAIQSLGGGDGGVIDEIGNANNGSILEIDVIAFPGVIDQTSVLGKITEMNRILREDADISTSDLPCCLEFKLGTFYRQKKFENQVVPEKIESNTVLSNFARGKLTVLVVKSIDQCATTASNIFGCTAQQNTIDGSLPIAVDANVPGYVWLHELGHASGFRGEINSINNNLCNIVIQGSEISQTRHYMCHVDLEWGETPEGVSLKECNRLKTFKNASSISRSQKSCDF